MHRNVNAFLNMKYKTEIVCTYNNECVQDIDYVKFPLGMNTQKVNKFT